MELKCCSKSTLNAPLFAFPTAVLRPWISTTSCGLRVAAAPHCVPLKLRLSEEPEGHKCPEMIFILCIMTRKLWAETRNWTVNCQPAALPCLYTQDGKWRGTNYSKLRFVCSRCFIFPKFKDRKYFVINSMRLFDKNNTHCSATKQLFIVFF